MRAHEYDRALRDERWRDDARWTGAQRPCLQPRCGGALRCEGGRHVDSSGTRCQTWSCSSDDPTHAIGVPVDAADLPRATGSA